MSFRFVVASPIVCKTNDVGLRISELEAKMNAKLVSLPESMVDELRDAVPIPTVQLLRYEENPNDSLGMKVEDLLSTSSALNKHILSLPSICLPQNAPQAMMHAYLRVRHTSHIHSLYKVGKTVQLPPSSIEEFQSLQLPDNCDTTDGFLLEELLNLLASVIRVAQDCGTICALYTLLGSVHPNRAGTKFSYFNSEGMPKNNKRMIGQVIQAHVLDVDVSRLEDMVKEVASGPFTPAFENFKSNAVFSLVDCFVALISSCPRSFLRKSCDDFKEMRVKKPNSLRMPARDIILRLMESLASESILDVAIGSTGFISAVLPEDAAVPTLGLICHAMSAAIECIIASLSYADLPFFGDFSVEELSPANFPSADELDVDPLPSLHSFQCSASPISFSLISNKVRAFLSFLLARINSSSAISMQDDVVPSNPSPDWACVVFCRTITTTVRIISTFL